MRKLLVLGGLAAAAAFAAKKKLGSDSEAVWHTPDTDPDSGSDSGADSGTDSGSLSAVPDDGHSADDAAGAGPDEALADAVEEPHPVTTPDAPADEVQVDPPDNDK